MASIKPDPNSGIYYIRFRFRNRNLNRSLGTKKQRKAEAAKLQIEERLDLLGHGIITLNPRVDPIQFVMTNDQTDRKMIRKPLTSLSGLFNVYFDEIPETAKEKSTFAGERKHTTHLLRHLGFRVNPQFLTAAQLQDFVKKRSHDTHRKKPIQAGTIEKELTTFKMIWNWAVRRNYLLGPSPTLGVVLPKKMKSQDS